MPPTDDKRTYPEREPWFWVGVGFVGALAVLLLGLVVATFLMTREPQQPSSRSVGQAVSLPSGLPNRADRQADSLPHLKPPMVSAQPPLPLKPIKPRRTGAAPLDHQAPATESVPKVRSSTSRKMAPAVRIVERAGVPRVGSATPRPSPPRSGKTSSDPSQSRGPGAESALAPAEQVGGARQEWVEALPRERFDGATRRTQAQPTIDDDDASVARSRRTTPPELIAGREAEYPLDAMADGATGSVALKISVDRDGFVERAVVVRSSGDRRLDAAAIRASLAWRYQPAHRGRQAVAGVDTAIVDFFREGRPAPRE